ncbi:MAG: cbb3-type cytochrome oxidase assembly protein CcoS [Rhodobiaceae bacterium]|nr:cbb3-type cytochrome oxidase assembly protein CcoS [Rhodobiaceae bacterium]MCC0055036.1 cbb3-type cytochrome oxidase assembly protein CcoS [Rhodobiaceae bacterium]
MNILLILIPVALLLGLIGLAAFLWSMKSGQFDDLDGAALRVLEDDDLPDESRQEKRPGDE